MTSGMQQFLQVLADQYVKVTNLVLAHSPKCSPEDLRCAIDDAQWRVDRTQVPEMFVKAWNAAGGSIDEFEWSEWKWGLGHLLVSTKRTVAQAVRTQCNDESMEDEQVYVGDTVLSLSLNHSQTPTHSLIVILCTLQADARHSYYCVGAVWRSVKKHFCSVKRISDVIEKMFVDKPTARKLGLPTQEVSERYVSHGTMILCVMILILCAICYVQHIQKSSICKRCDIPTLHNAG